MQHALRRPALLVAVLLLTLPAPPHDAQAQSRKERRQAEKEAATDGAKQDERWSVSEFGGHEWPSTEVTVDVDEGTWMNLDVSPDGSEIVFDLLGDIFLMPIAGGEARQLTSGAAWDMQPKFSPDGNEIAFTSDRGGGDNIWVLERGEDASWDGTRQVTKETFRLPNSPAWAPDGQFLAARKHFSSRRSLGSGEIWLWHASGEGSGLQLNEKPNEQKDLGEPEFSPDGRYVYFSQDTTPGDAFQYSKDSNDEIYTVRRIDRTTGEIETVIDGPGGAVRPQPSPDGRYLAFVRRVHFQSTLFVHDLESGENRALYDGLDRDNQEIWAIHGVYPSYEWTPDSRSIVIWAGGKIRRVDVADGGAEVIPFRARATHRIHHALRYPVDVAPETFHTKMVRWAQMSPDGSRVVFQALGHLYTRSVERDGAGRMALGAPRRLTGDERFEHYPSFSRDGRWVVYTTWDDKDLATVQIVAAGGGEPFPLSEAPGHYFEPALSPDGSTLVYRKGQGGFLTSPLWSKEPGLYRVSVDLTGDRPRTVGEPTRFAESGFQPHFGDGSDRVYFTGFGGDRRVLRSQRVDGPLSGDVEAREHATSENATEFRVSPDGTLLAFSERFQAFVVPMPDASKPLALSPDFKSLPMRRVSQDAGEWIDWSGDSSRLYWSMGPDFFETAVAFPRRAGDGDGDATGSGGSRDSEDSEDSESSDAAASVDLGFAVTRDLHRARIALVGAKVLTMAPGKDGADERGILEDGVVVTEGDRIAAVGPRSEVEIPADAVVVDVSGKVVMPGLLDVHWHGSQGVSEIIPQQNYYNLSSLSFGVTTVHDPSNDTSTFFAASEMQKAGMIPAPRLFSTGTILYGAAGPAKAEIESLDDARAHLRRLKAAGAFSVKSYNQPRRDQRQQGVEAARELDMMGVNEGGALFLHNMTMVMDGHTGIEHSLSVAEIYDDVLQFWGGPETMDVAGITPTLGVAFGGIEGERYWYHHTDVYDNERLLRWVPSDRVDPRARRVPKAPEGDYNHIRAAAVCRQLRDAGVIIGLGAHGQREGLAAHWELWMFEQGGMSPLEALEAGTIDGARHLGLDGDLGSLEPGKLADLIVLEEDPLEDLRSSEKISHTMLGGRLYDALTLQEIAPGAWRPETLWFQSE